MCTKLRAVNLSRALAKRVDSQQSCLQKQLQAAKLCAVKTACSKNCVQQNCVQQCAHELTHSRIECSKKLMQRKFILCSNTLSLPLPPRGPTCRPARSFIAQSGFKQFMSILPFAAVRWLQNQTYSNETVSHTKKAEHTQL